MYSCLFILKNVIKSRLLLTTTTTTNVFVALCNCLNTYATKIGIVYPYATNVRLMLASFANVIKRSKSHSSVHPYACEITKSLNSGIKYDNNVLLLYTICACISQFCCSTAVVYMMSIHY